MSISLFNPKADPSTYLSGSRNINGPQQISNNSDAKIQHSTVPIDQSPDTARQNARLISRMLTRTQPAQNTGNNIWRQHLITLGYNLKDLKHYMSNAYPLQQRAFDKLLNKASELPEYIIDNNSADVDQLLSDFIYEVRILRIHIISGQEFSESHAAVQVLSKIKDDTKKIRKEIISTNMPWQKAPLWISDLNNSDNSSELSDLMENIEDLLDTVNELKIEGKLPPLDTDLIDKLSELINELNKGATQRLNAVLGIVNGLESWIQTSNDSYDEIRTLKADISDIQECRLFKRLKNMEDVGSQPNSETSVDTWKKQSSVLEDTLSVLTSSTQTLLSPTTSTIHEIIFERNEEKISHEQYVNIRMRLLKATEIVNELPDSIKDDSDRQLAKNVLERFLNEIKAIQSSNELGQSHKAKVELSSIRVLLQDVKRQARRMRTQIPE